MRAFGYLADPLFRLACLLYAVNRWLVLPHVGAGFLRGQFNDVLLIPAALPPVLWLQRELRLRAHDAAPLWSEIVFHLVIWSVLFEAVGPRVFPVTGDVRDVVAYWLGGGIAGLWWHWHPDGSTTGP